MCSSCIQSSCHHLNNFLCRIQFSGKTFLDIYNIKKFYLKWFTSLPFYLQLVKEYTNVDRFEVTDPDSNYRAVIAIYQNGLSPIFETFIENHYNDLPSTPKIVEQDESFSVATERISEVKTELAVQKVATSRQFIDLKDHLTFGPDQIRSDVSIWSLKKNFS